MARLLSLCLLAPLACTTASPPEPAVNPSQTPPIAAASPPPETTPPPAETTPPPAVETAPPAVTTAPPVPTTRPGETTWTDAGNNLSVRLELPRKPPRIGDSVALRLHFRNTGTTPLRIYMIQSETFRAQQSDLTISAADGTFLGAQPEPHPHGYVVGERDFPAIAPGEDQVHVQTLSLKGPKYAGQTGPLELRWTYTNRVESWAGGAKTLDGPTKALFGGGPIPGIWRGEVFVDASLPLAR